MHHTTRRSSRVSRVSIGAATLAFVWAGRLGVAQAQAPTDPYLGFEGHILDAGNIQLPYRLMRPPAFDANKKYPLVVFLHGSGESGTDNKIQIQKNIGVPTGGSVFTEPANETLYPNFFVAPQAPVGSRDGWRGIPGQAVLKLITAMEHQFPNIDVERIYLTGLSMGGFGTWSLIEDNPKLFACAIPMSAGGDTTKAANIKDLPIWNFHGTIDQAVPVKESRDMIAAIVAAGGHPIYTEYPNGGHGIWDQAYTEPKLLPWIFAQRAVILGPDSGVADAAGASDAGLGARANDAASSSEIGAASPVDAAAGQGAGDDGGAHAGADTGTVGGQPTDDASNGCSCRMARSSRYESWRIACILALGLLLTRRRRVSSLE